MLNGIVKSFDRIYFLDLPKLCFPFIVESTDKLHSLETNRKWKDNNNSE